MTTENNFEATKALILEAQEVGRSIMMCDQMEKEHELSQRVLENRWAGLLKLLDSVEGPLVFSMGSGKALLLTCNLGVWDGLVTDAHGFSPSPDRSVF